ncbi:hypothetical protein TI39_contig283g00012 [Zymoseptoria brevis]|uniref:Uncharacterized protein n=1 Tax=Zymoseptoria brevis TaxID=1047168 RepID=A0A0F4GWP9_9PEZI|nr:hypothetical protein TI39_contig283g00012 [Zymoseptoria brevis]
MSSHMSYSSAAASEVDEIRALRRQKVDMLEKYEWEVKSFAFRHSLHGKADDQAESLQMTRQCSELRRDIADLDERLSEASSTVGSSRAGSYRGPKLGSKYGNELGPDDSISQFGGSSRSEASRASAMGGGSRIAGRSSEAGSSRTGRSESRSRDGRSGAGSYADRQELGGYASRSSPRAPSGYDDDEASEASTVRPGRSSSSVRGRSERSIYTAEYHYTTEVRYTTEIRVPPGVSGSHSASFTSKESYSGRIREPGGFSGPHPLGSPRYPEIQPGSYAGGYASSSAMGSSRADSTTSYSSRPTGYTSSSYSSRPGTSSGSSSRRHGSYAGSYAGSESGFSAASSQSGYTAREPRSDNFYPASLDPRSRSGTEGRRSGSSRHDAPSTRRSSGPSNDPPRTRYQESTSGPRREPARSGYAERSSSTTRQDDTRSHHSRPSTRDGSFSRTAQDHEYSRSGSRHGSEAPRPSQARYTESPRGAGSSTSRAPPRSHASSALPSRAAVDAWWTSVDTALKDYTIIRKFPGPPGGLCGRLGCQAKASQRALTACEHMVKNALIVANPDLRKMRLRFHPDRFSACPGDRREEFKKMASEIFVVIEELIAEKK